MDPTTYRLVSRLVANPRGRSVSAGLAEVGRAAAERRQRLIAYVKAAVPLTEQQRDRLTAVLRRLYGQEVHLNLDLDPAGSAGCRCASATRSSTARSAPGWPGPSGS